MHIGGIKIAACDGKQQYQTRQLARRIAAKSKVMIEAYKCDFCGHYHVGAKRVKTIRRPE